MSSFLDVKARAENGYSSPLESKRDGLGQNGQGGDIAAAELEVSDTVVALVVMEVDCP